MTDTTIIEWRSRHGLTQTEAAAVLGFSRRQVQMWEALDDPIPDHVQVAMRYIDKHPNHVVDGYDKYVRPRYRHRDEPRPNARNGG